MKGDEDYVSIESFIEEMVSIIEGRLRKQEEAIARMEAEVKALKSSVKKSAKGELKIDKSVLKVIRQ